MNIPTPKYIPGQVIRYVDKQTTGITKYSIQECRIVSVVAEYTDMGIYKAYESSYGTGRESEIPNGINVTFRYKFSMDFGHEPGTYTSEGILESQIIGLSNNSKMYVPVLPNFIEYKCSTLDKRRFYLQGSGVNHRSRIDHLYSHKKEIKQLGATWNGNGWTIVTHPNSLEFNRLQYLEIELIGSTYE